MSPIDKAAFTPFDEIEEAFNSFSKLLKGSLPKGRLPTLADFGGHQIALTQLGGLSRKGFIASSPSDCNAFKSVAGEAQRALHKMGALL